MATAETVEMGLSHPPKEESIKAFNEIEVDLKKAIQHLRHETTKHEPQYFQAVSNLSNEQLTTFSSSDLKEVRVATSAYGLHLFGKVLLPESDNQASYFMFRAFIAGDAETAKLHCIHLEETERPDGDKDFRAIFTKNDRLEWFDV
ncbi:hypothetical protein HYFRA_00008826 [Hymenoscyphus fraxineus]|uniref:Uncharacterized protein n=1 Tax=Hymenoscyphus fraxineus TaxID=746836 RepID=A0A9N9PQN1_9HELO|nr:hypothetical protein HYFRA_00008826 [Hymenoscyphus fraxineus]